MKKDVFVDIDVRRNEMNWPRKIFVNWYIMVVMGLAKTRECHGSERIVKDMTHRTGATDGSVLVHFTSFSEDARRVQRMMPAAKTTGPRKT